MDELKVDGDSEAVRLQAGDLVVLPRGNGHQMRDSRESRVLWLDNILAETPPANGRLSHGGGGERAEVICGGFTIDQLTARPLLEALPRVVHLRGHEGRAPEWLAGLIRMISLEMASSGPGAEAVVSRLTDVLLAQALRTHLVETDHTNGGAVSDPQVARALKLIRERPDEKVVGPQAGGRRGSVPIRLQQTLSRSDRGDPDPEPHPLSTVAGGGLPAHDQRRCARDRAADRVRLRGVRQQGLPASVRHLARRISKGERHYAHSVVGAD